jgi:hypothetical protein
VSSRFVVGAAASAAAFLVLAGPGLGTTNPAATVPIKVTITDRAIRCVPNTSSRGVSGLFILTNRGTKVHTVTLKDVGLGKRPSFTAKLGPDQQKTFVMFLDYRGLLHLRSIDGSALVGTFKVT